MEIRITRQNFERIKEYLERSIENENCQGLILKSKRDFERYYEIPKQIKK